MPTPTPAKLATALKGGRNLQPLAKKFAKKIFEEILQGDEFADEVEELLVQWDFLSLDDPDDDVKVLNKTIDEVWNRILADLIMKMQDTRRYDG